MTNTTIPNEQAYRYMKYMFSRKTDYKLVDGKTAWGGSSCKVEISDQRPDGTFDIIAKEISSKSGSEVRRILITVPNKRLSATADCSIYIPENHDIDTPPRPVTDEKGNRAANDDEIQTVDDNESQAKTFFVNLREGIVILRDLTIQPSLIQSLDGSRPQFMDCRQ